MLKKCQKKLLLLCFIIQPLIATKQAIEIESAEQQIQYLSKDKQLLELQAVAEHINKIKPLQGYMLAVPTFFIITDNELINFLNSMPSPDVSTGKKIRKKQKRLSMLDHLQALWQKVTRTLSNKDSLTPEAIDLLAHIREDIQLAFNHDITTISPRLASFIKKAIQQESPLIVHPIEDESLHPLKSAFPVKPTDINQAIGEIVASYYADATIEELLQRKALPKNIYGQVALQHFIMNNNDEYPLTSGICCPYDRATNGEDISTITAVYGNQSGLKNEQIAKDIFYVYQDRVYPIIAQKLTRLDAHIDMHDVRMISNMSEIQEKPTLDAAAVKALSHAIHKITDHFGQPTCVSFIKYSRTIYLLGLEFPNIQISKKPNYIDALYVKKALKDNAITIASLTPQQEVIIAKKRNHIILAPDIPTLFTLYHEREDKKARVGIVKKSAEPWSHEHKLLNKIDIPVIWSSQFDEIKRLIDINAWPIIVDPQHKLLILHKKRKGFCTLFQTIEHGIKDHPGPDHISVIPSFVETLTPEEQKALRPDEFFSGVTMEHLFDLIKHAPTDSALQALRTVLYRLQLSIKRVEYALQEASDTSKAFHLERLSYLQNQYAYIEQVAYQLYTTLHKINDHDGHNKLKRLFLVNVLELLITQTPDQGVVNSVSFTHMLK